MCYLVDFVILPCLYGDMMIITTAGIPHISQPLENRRVLPYHQILSGCTACLCAKKETIYGHFLICYLSLFLLRILEIKSFNNEINSYDLVNFMRDFRVVAKGDGTYINISQNQSVNEKIKKLTGLTNLRLFHKFILFIFTNIA